jgi:hypothetical protein
MEETRQEAILRLASEAVDRMGSGSLLHQHLTDQMTELALDIKSSLKQDLLSYEDQQDIAVQAVALLRTMNPHAVEAAKRSLVGVQL